MEEGMGRLAKQVVRTVAGGGEAVLQALPRGAVRQAGHKNTARHANLHRRCKDTHIIAHVRLDLLNKVQAPLWRSEVCTTRGKLLTTARHRSGISAAAPTQQNMRCVTLPPSQGTNSSTTTTGSITIDGIPSTVHPLKVGYPHMSTSVRLGTQDARVAR